MKSYYEYGMVWYGMEWYGLSIDLAKPNSTNSSLITSFLTLHAFQF